MDHYVEQVVDLIDPSVNRIYNLRLEEARACVLEGTPEALAKIDGSFALTAREGKIVRMARSLDRPMRYFLAKRSEGPALIIAERMDTIHDYLRSQGLGNQFHPSYTRMVPAHYGVTIQLVGCPDPDPTYTRFFDPQHDTLPTDLDSIGKRYIGALAEEIAKWLRQLPQEAPIGVSFSGGVDSGAVFLTTYHVLRRLGCNLSRLKAFTLDMGQAPDLEQALRFLSAVDLELFLEPIQGQATSIDIGQTLRILEDYKPLDVECASMNLALFRGIRERYPSWRYLIDGDGGDENLKDYPIEENPELTIRSVVHNQMLYHEGWGVGRIKHSLTYSGGLSRSYTRTYAPGRHYGFETFSPFTRPAVIEVAEGIPYIALTDYEVPRLYALKGEIAARGIRHLTGMTMPVFEKRRFQHGALPRESLRRHLPEPETFYRHQFLSLYS